MSLKNPKTDKSRDAGMKPVESMNNIFTPATRTNGIPEEINKHPQNVMQTTYINFVNRQESVLGGHCRTKLVKTG